MIESNEFATSVRLLAVNASSVIGFIICFSFRPQCARTRCRWPTTAANGQSTTTQGNTRCNRETWVIGRWEAHVHATTDTRRRMKSAITERYKITCSLAIFLRGNARERDVKYQIGPQCCDTGRCLLRSGRFRSTGPYSCCYQSTLSLDHVPLHGLLVRSLRRQPRRGRPSP